MPEDCDTCGPSTFAQQPGGPDAPLNPQTSQAGDLQPKEDPLDASTFTCPLDVTSSGRIPTPTVVIEYCDRCRWQHRATWVQTELFLTFPPPKPSSGSSDAAPTPPPTKASGGASIRSIMLIPLVEEETGGRFRVWLLSRPQIGAAVETHMLWDRKIEGGFPELKELKQRVRDKIAPQRSLGHSDKGGKHGQATQES